MLRQLQFRFTRLQMSYLQKTTETNMLLLPTANSVADMFGCKIRIEFEKKNLIGERELSRSSKSFSTCAEFLKKLIFYHLIHMYVCISGVGNVSLSENFVFVLTHQVPVLPSYKNQSIDLPCKSVDWFQYEGNTGT